MDTTIRNLDETVYRQLKAYAALQGRTIGDVVSESVALYLKRQAWPRKRGSIADLPSWSLGPGAENLSEEIDEILYGSKR